MSSSPFPSSLWRTAMARRVSREAERATASPPVQRVAAAPSSVQEKHARSRPLTERARWIVGKLPVGAGAARWLWALWNTRTTRLMAHATAERLTSLEPSVRSEIRHLCSRLEELARAMPTVQSELAALRGGLSAAAQELGSVASLRRELARLRAELRLLLTKAETASAAAYAPSAQVDSRTPTLSSRWDAALLAMMDETRGTFSEIKDRLRVHLSAIRRAEAGSPTRPILDLGCGRGEWLELVGEEGLCAEGVDLSPAAVAACRERGLIAHQRDAIEALRRCPNSSLGAITAFHLIEHLDLEQHAALLDHALRALAPRGLLLLETPNGESFSVSGRSFWFDPTHRVLHTPASLWRWLDAAGFTEISISRLHPYPDSARFLPSPISDSLNEWFFGPQDFAIMAYRP